MNEYIVTAPNEATDDLYRNKWNVPRLVRCRDCRFGLRGTENVVCMRNSFHFAHDLDWFCADGRNPEEKGTAE